MVTHRRFARENGGKRRIWRAIWVGFGRLIIARSGLSPACNHQDELDPAFCVSDDKNRHSSGVLKSVFAACTIQRDHSRRLIVIFPARDGCEGPCMRPPIVGVQRTTITLQYSDAGLSGVQLNTLAVP